VDAPSRIRQLVDELKRRRVLRTGGVYLAGAFVVLQVADLVLQAEFFPAWSYDAAVLLTGLGLPVALVLAWAFDITPSGIRRADAEDGAADVSTAEGRAFRRTVRLALAMVVVAAAGGTGFILWDDVTRAGRPDRGRTAAVADASGDPLRIAVLYLEDESRDRSLDYLARGLSEGLMAALGEVDTLQVVSRNAVRAARDGRVTVDELVDQLGVGTYVEGSLTRASEGIRVSANLVDASTRYTLSTHVVEMPAGDVFEIQDSLVTELSEALRRRLGVEINVRSLAAQGENVESWVLVQRAGRLLDEAPSLWERQPDQVLSALQRADSLLADAEALQPGWADPILQRGWLEWRRSRYAAELPGQGVEAPLRAAESHARRALGEGGGAAARELRGVVRFDLAGAVEDPAERARLLALARSDLEEAVRENPALARAWWNLSEVLRMEGNVADAQRFAGRALEEDAFMEDAPLVYRQLFQTAFEAEDREGASLWCREGRRRFPSEADPVLCGLLIVATMAPAGPESPAAALAISDTLVRVVPSADSSAWRMYADMQVAKAFARRGMADSADVYIARAHGGEYQSWLGYDEAHTRILLGQPDSALTLLRGYLEDRPERREYWPTDWWLRDLWDDPRFVGMTSSSDGGG